MPVPARSSVIVSQHLPFVKHLLYTSTVRCWTCVLSHDLHRISESGTIGLNYR